MEKVWKLSLLVVVGVLGLVSCGGDSVGAGVVPSGTVVPVEEPLVPDPKVARDVGLAYIRTYHTGEGPPAEAFWFEETGTSEDQVGSSTYLYRYEVWVVTVSFPVVAPAETIYTVSVERPTPNFFWQGLVKSDGQVSETSFSLEEPVPTAAPPTITPDIPTAVAPTATAELTWTATASPKQTATEIPTFTPVPVPCNAAEFIMDVTIQDGTSFSPGADFTKIWRLKNVGTCAWTSDYELVYVDGSRMEGEQSQVLPVLVKPGNTVDIEIELAAPEDPGDYKGFWKLKSADAELFGLGEMANESFWVSISVVDFRKSDYIFDFALNFCSASWQSETGDLSCPGIIASPDGYVQLLSEAELENRTEDEPTLWMHPNEARYGWIEGRFPIHEVEKGDHFRAWVGCMKGYQSCDLTYYLDYENRKGKVFSLGEWIEIYDGEVTEIDIDLSNLEGERIRLILGVEANTKNVADAQGFWFVPRIE